MYSRLSLICFWVNVPAAMSRANCKQARQGKANVQLLTDKAHWIAVKTQRQRADDGGSQLFEDYPVL
jgi:hypothetical protein